MNEYISAFETRYVKGIGQVLTDPMTIPCYRTDDNLCTISSCWNLVILTCSSSHIMRSANFQTLIHYSKMFVFIFRGLLIFWDVSFDSINEIKSSFPNQLGPLLIVIVNNIIWEKIGCHGTHIAATCEKEEGICTFNSGFCATERLSWTMVHDKSIVQREYNLHLKNKETIFIHIFKVMKILQKYIQ